MAFRCTYAEDDVERRTPLCGHCGHDELVELCHEGEVCCTKCGTVVEDHIMVDDSVNLFVTDTGDVNPNVRHGGPISVHMPQTSLSTRIGFGGKGLSRMARRLHQNNTMPSQERTLFKRFKDLDLILTRLDIDSKIVTEWSNTLWADLKHRHVMAKGHNNRALMAACVYYACKLSNFNRPQEDIIEAASLPNEFADKFGVETKRVMEALVDAPYFQDLIKDTESDDQVPMYVGKLKLGFGERWPLVKETRRVLAVFEEHEKFVSAHEDTRVATAVFVAICNLDIRVPLVDKDADGIIVVRESSAEVEGPSNRSSINLNTVACLFDVKAQTLRINLKQLASGPIFKEVYSEKGSRMVSSFTSPAKRQRQA